VSAPPAEASRCLPIVTGSPRLRDGPHRRECPRRRVGRFGRLRAEVPQACSPSATAAPSERARQDSEPVTFGFVVPADRVA
jgi:hypothetical protein